MTAFPRFPAGLPSPAAIRATLRDLAAHADPATAPAYVAALRLCNAAPAAWHAGVLHLPATPDHPPTQVRAAPGRQPLPWACTCPMGRAGQPCAYAALAEGFIATGQRLADAYVPGAADDSPRYAPGDRVVVAGPAAGVVGTCSTRSATSACCRWASPTAGSTPTCWASSSPGRPGGLDELQRLRAAVLADALFVVAPPLPEGDLR